MHKIIASADMRWKAATKVKVWKSLTSGLPILGTGLSLLMFSPICGTEVKERWSAWLTGRRAREGEEAGSITWTQLLRLTTAIHHLHPPSAPRQPSHPHIQVGFPARSARHSVIPKKPLLASIENLSGILKQPSLCSSPSSLSSFLLHVSHFSHLWLQVNCPWQ